MIVNKKLWYFHWEHFRIRGRVESVFIATQEEVDQVIGRDIYFGEILGKHSELVCNIEAENFTLISEDPYVIKSLEDVCGQTISGYNPIIYLKEQEDE